MLLRSGLSSANFAKAWHRYLASIEEFIEFLKKQQDLSPEVHALIDIRNEVSAIQIGDKYDELHGQELMAEYHAIVSTLTARLAWRKKKAYLTVSAVYVLEDRLIFIEYSDGEFRKLDIGNYIEEHHLQLDWDEFLLARPSGNTIVWPDGQTLSAEYLYTNSRGL